MANPSSSHRDHDRDRVVRERSHHHHRTISSTTLLLILSLVLAVLAVMLSLPQTRAGAGMLTSAGRGPNAAAANANTDVDGDVTSNGAGLWGSFFNPRRSEGLISREHSVAKRESEVAQREADILANALVTCVPYATVTEVVELAPPPATTTTIYREIISEREIQMPTPVPDKNESEIARRVEDVIQRETKVAEREKDMGRREEMLNRREHDAQRRESWIMEQLIALGGDPQVIEEEYIIAEPPSPGKQRKVKPLPSNSGVTVTHTETHSVLAPAGTRPAAPPLPLSLTPKTEPPAFPTQVVEVVYDDGDDEETVTVRRTARPSLRRPFW